MEGRALTLLEALAKDLGEGLVVDSHLIPAPVGEAEAAVTAQRHVGTPHHALKLEKICAQTNAWL